MTEGTQTQDKGVEEEARLNELSGNNDKTPEETKEFETLRKAKDDRTAKNRIEELSGKTKDAEREALQAKTRADELQRQIDDLKKEPRQATSTNQVEAGGKMYDTDETLRAKIDAGSISENEAYKIQQDRNNEIAADKAYTRLKGEQEKTATETRRQQEVTDVFAKYPTWNKNSPDFDPSDPVYQTANEYFQEGLGIKKAMQLAEKLHGKVGTKPDVSDQLGVHGASAPGESTEKVKEVAITKDEEEIAFRLYRNKVNPNTGRNYTEAESIAKFKKAKSARPNRRI